MDAIDLGSPRDGEWRPEERATFTYSMPFDSNSEIAARLHHRTGQTVTVLSRGEDDGDEETFADRADSGSLRVYEVRFPDGYVDTAFEDELTDLN